MPIYYTELLQGVSFLNELRIIIRNKINIEIQKAQ